VTDALGIVARVAVIGAGGALAMGGRELPTDDGQASKPRLTAVSLGSSGLGHPDFVRSRAVAAGLQPQSGPQTMPFAGLAITREGSTVSAPG
jgi:hypothetical protein